MTWLFWALAGWCGTPWRRFPPPPPPDPWFSIRVVGILGGLAGGWGFERIFASDPMPGVSAISVAATCVGAFIGGRVLSELSGMMLGGKANH